MEPHYAAANLAEPHHNGCRLGLPENPQPVCSLQLGRNRSKGGLFFADLQDSATRQDWFTNWKHVDVPLLARQEAFFSDVRGAMLFMEADLEHIRKGWPRNLGFQSRWCYPSLRCTIPQANTFPRGRAKIRRPSTWRVLRKPNDPRPNQQHGHHPSCD